MAILARLQTTLSKEDRRASPRRQLALGSSVGGEDVTIHDLSSTGVLVETMAELRVFDDLEIELPEAGIIKAIVVWSSGQFYGCEFRETISQAAISAALLRSPPAISADLAQATLPLEVMTAAPIEAQAPEEFEPYDPTGEEKAPLGVRLRVILGSALALWMLIIWAIASIAKMIR